MKKDTPKLGKVIEIDEARIQDHLGELVRGSVEDTLNALLEAEAERLCNAARYERTEARRDTRAGSYERTLHTKAGKVKLNMPKLRRQTFETAIIERYRRREASVEEALIEMYLAGVSVRRVEDITEALWGPRSVPRPSRI
jgi:putative transposase